MEIYMTLYTSVWPFESIHYGAKSYKIQYLSFD